MATLQMSVPSPLNAGVYGGLGDIDPEFDPVHRKPIYSEAPGILYVITRRDLTNGYQLAQSCHAVAEFANQHPLQFAHWHDSSNTVVVLSVKREAELIALIHTLVIINQAEPEPIQWSMFREPDINDSLTAVAIGPHPKVKNLLTTLPLALPEPRHRKFFRKRLGR